MREIKIIIGLFAVVALTTLMQPSLVKAANSTPTINKKVYLLIFDPVLTSQGNKRLTEYKGYYNPITSTNKTISAISQMTQGRVNYTVVKTDYSNEYLAKSDGFRYTEASYLDCLNNSSGCHQPDIINYNQMIDTYNICNRFNAGEFDELWMYGGPYFGFYESNLAGPGAYWYNSPATTGTNCNRLLPIMGYSYERDYDLMIHNFGHRAESALSILHGNWNASSPNPNKWERFTVTTHLNSAIPASGCGNIHYPPNATGDYDYTNPRTVNTYCNSFPHNFNEDAPYANQTTVNCSAWGCTAPGYYHYWFSRFPSSVGYDNRGITNDWIRVAFEPGFLYTAEAKRVAPPPPTTPAPSPTPSPQQPPETPETPEESTEPEQEVEEPAAPSQPENNPDDQSAAEEDLKTEKLSRQVKEYAINIGLITLAIVFMVANAVAVYIYYLKQKYHS